VVPVYILSPEHLYHENSGGQPPDSIAEIVWHGIADPGTAAWNRQDRTCTDTYCHGNFGGGNASNAPVWTAADQAACGTCHDIGGDPDLLAGIHPYHIETVDLTCGDCHASVADTLLNITNPALHVDGRVDTLTRDPSVCAACHGSGPEVCVRCHGGTDSQTGAPPLGLEGETSTTQLAVGAHTVHMEGGAQADAFVCSDCHLVPANLIASGHIGADDIAEITWGLLAGATSSWERSTATCSNTYCHGNFVGGNVSNSPVWTGTDQAACGSCHDAGSDPDRLLWIHPFHVNTVGLSCGECHASVTDTLLNIVNKALHVNGQVETLTRDQSVCNKCHGTGPEVCVQCHGGIDNQTGSPPRGLEGETSTTELAVGAHTVHMEGGAVADGFACSDCHRVPTVMLDFGHLGVDSIAEITWSPLAGSSSSWNRLSATCSNTYCHGNFAGGNGSNSTVWTGSGQADCGSCHDVGSDPESLSGKHKKHINDENLDCMECHQTVVNLQLDIIGPANHVNSIKDVSIFRGGTYQGGSCSGLDGATCHGTESWD
jgi:predicted CxxxxCH...CXXCH cytochrome family protein